MNYPAIPREFFNGDCFDAYRILGAHPCSDNGIEGWRFAVWAPGATAVEVCGGFDGWEAGVPMEKADTGVWSAFVPGLAEGDLYKYRVHGADGSVVMRSDPYAFSTELRPGTASRLAELVLNMGFSESINAIFENVPEDRNTLLFSATMSKDIEKIALNYLHDHKEIVVGSRNEGAEHVNHIYYLVNAKDKYLALKRVVDFYPRIFAIIFCRTKLETQDIADKLIKDGYNAEALHGDLSQQQRDLTMQKFRNHTVQFLVATDVAARGLDVEDLTHVINYGLPDDVASYTHRSGRTGRAGKKGTSISIIHTREKFKVRQIEKQIGKDFVDGVLPTPEEICKKQLFKTMDDIMKTDVDEDQIEPYMAEINRQFEYIDKEDIIKKMVTITFGKFLDYYKNAPEIIKPETGKGSRGGEGRGSRGEGRGKVSNGRRKHETEVGFKRLFINLGKADGFYPGEIISM